MCDPVPLKTKEEKKQQYDLSCIVFRCLGTRVQVPFPAQRQKKKKECTQAVYFADKQCYHEQCYFKAFAPLRDSAFSPLAGWLSACDGVFVHVRVCRVYIYLCQSHREARGQPC